MDMVNVVTVLKVIIIDLLYHYILPSVVLTCVQVKESEKWLCYMCSPEHSHIGLLEKREDWDKKLRELFLNDHEMEYVSVQFTELSRNYKATFHFEIHLSWALKESSYLHGPAFKMYLIHTFFCMQDLPAFHPTIPPEERRPIRVLGLFDGIATGLVALKELGVEVTKYVSSEIDTDAIFVSMVQHNEIEHVGDVASITEKEVSQSNLWHLSKL